ncbi:MAG: CopG family transcriptional regulator [Thermoprotei archaeon]|nr:MAG: CopG family transcriptional regulator [Thermoprotei archaeon]
MKGVKNELRILTVHLPDAYIQGLDELVNQRFYPNRSEAIRVAVRDLLKKELWEQRNKELRSLKVYG